MVRECIRCEREISDIASLCSRCAEEFLSDNIFGLIASPLICSPPIDRYKKDSEPILTIGERPEGELIFEPGEKVLEELKSIEIEEIDEKSYERFENRMNVILAEMGVSKDIDFDSYLFSKEDTKVLSQIYYCLEELEHEDQEKKGCSTLYLRLANLFYHSYRCADTSLLELDFKRSIKDDYKEKAEGYYELAVEASGEDHEDKIYALRNRAYLLLECGETGRAEDIFEEALSIDPDDLKSRLGLVKLFLEEDRLEEAETYIEESMDDFEDVPEGWFLKGELAGKRDRWGRAIQFYNNSLDLEEGKRAVPALLSKGSLFLKNDRLGKAAETFEKVLEMDEENIDALEGLSEIKEKQGDSGEALRWLNKALAEDSHRKDLWTKRADVLKGMGNYKKAVKDYENALKIDSEYGPAVEGKEECMDELE